MSLVGPVVFDERLINGQNPLIRVFTDQAWKQLNDEIESGRHPIEEFMSYDYRPLSINECAERWVRQADRGKFGAEYLEKIFASEEKKPDGTVGRYRRFMTEYAMTNWLIKSAGPRTVS